jgi:SNF2 family DNA or RNA helicase
MVLLEVSARAGHAPAPLRFAPRPRGAHALRAPDPPPAHRAAGAPPDQQGGFTVREDQAAGANHVYARLIEQSGFILADDMGMGKTLQAAIVGDRIGGHALFLVLASNITHWDQQLRKACPDRDVRTVGRDAADSLLAFWLSTHWLIMSYERFVEIAKHGLLVAGDQLVCDEAHTLSNAQARKSREVAMLPKRRCQLLTGTPTASDLMELYTPHSALSPTCLPCCTRMSRSSTRSNFKHTVQLQAAANAREATVRA